MKILIVSDTHRKDDIFAQVLKKESPVDLIIHAGDAEGSEDYFEALTDAPFYYVAGNNDFFSDAPYDITFRVGSETVFLTHGHHYYVSTSEQRVVEEALARGASVLIYGHTHRPVLRQEEGLLIMNPGSLAYPRQIGRRPSYIVAKLSDSGKLQPEIRYL